MKVSVYSLDGKKGHEVELPRVFQTAIDENLIKRAVLAVETTALQPHAPYYRSGMQNTAEYEGARHLPTSERSINIGRARRPRMKNRRGLIAGRVTSIPGSVGGPEAHPPKRDKKLVERINKKERRKAIESAIAATMNASLVKKRGHAFDEKIFPLVVEAKLEELKKTKEVVKVLGALNVLNDVVRAKKAKQVRAGKGKRRGRKFKRRKSVLIVVSGKTPIFKAARNLEGVDIVQAKQLNAALLAPGTHAGRLTLWSEKALRALEGSA
ncbi:MAG: 50S ribosomal protein L4 [Candidatus Diapherotrites archaeon]|nr:50S ribosomal protein L4 [Candidatus Diapherotrites archaeon]